MVVILKCDVTEKFHLLSFLGAYVVIFMQKSSHYLQKSSHFSSICCH